MEFVPSLAVPAQEPAAVTGEADKNSLPEATQVWYPESLDKPIPLKAQEKEVSPEYEGAGSIFFKAALWDIGIFSQDIKQDDWSYLLTYSKGVRVFLANGKDYFINIPLPIERCLRETADGLINNIKPLIVSQVSDAELFKASMEGQDGLGIQKICVVDQSDQVLFEFSSLVETKRRFIKPEYLWRV